MAKKQPYGRELWDRLCDFVGNDDGGPTFPCGLWTAQKLFFLSNYLAQTTQAMVGNPKFHSVNYVDLFAGSGVCAVQGDNLIRRYPGSALLAAGCRKPFTNLYLVEADQLKLDALVQRIRRFGAASNISSWCGDANTLVDQVVAAIPGRSLTVAFIDPYALQIHFDSIRRLALQRAVDLLILFADSMDIVRNVEMNYYPKRSDKLDLFLGSDIDWRNRWKSLPNWTAGNVRQLFAEIYLENLKKIGYGYSDSMVIEGDNGPLYRLIYASKHKLGLKFWDIASRENLSGDKGLWEP